MDRPRRALIFGAFATVYLVWGSTYLAIRYAVETLPPFLMAGIRFLIAGVILFAAGRLRGSPAPRAAEWRAGTLVGALFLLTGNGGVVWAAQRVPSGIVALLVAAVPLWVALFEWILPPRARPNPVLGLGLLLGFGGAAFLALQRHVNSAADVDPAGALALALASASWAAGSLVAQRTPRPGSHLTATAVQMIPGGLLLILAGLAFGEGPRFDLHAASARSLLACAYLILFGSIAAYTAYVWLLAVQPVSRVATYAYVNPVVAVFLGWAVAGETLTPLTIAAATIIVVSVVLVLRARPAGTPQK